MVLIGPFASGEQISAPMAGRPDLAASTGFVPAPGDAVPSSLEAFAQPYNSFLQAHVRRGGVDYIAAARDPRRPLIRAAIPEVDWEQLSPEGQKAYLIDAYNFLVIDLICARLPLESVMNVPGFFDRLAIDGPQGSKTLDALEKGLLYARFPDPRLHFVLVCGAKGCPELENRAFSMALPGGLDKRLDQATRRALNNPVLVSSEDGKLYLSRIFEWYAEDFGPDQAARLQWIGRYRSGLLPGKTEHETIDPEHIDVVYRDYNWRLNQIVDR